MLKEPITLPILWNSETAQDLIDLGLEPNEEQEIKKITFYNVDLVFQHNHRGKNYTVIRSGGDEYIVADNINSVNLAILSRLS